jgi:hypothetical protein
MLCTTTPLTNSYFHNAPTQTPIITRMLKGKAGRSPPYPSLQSTSSYNSPPTPQTDPTHRAHRPDNSNPLLRLPRPVEPAPTSFKRIHLANGELVEEFLVLVGVATRVCVGLIARTLRRLQWALRSEHCTSFVGGLQCAFPAGACVDVVDVLRAISVCLRPFSAHGRTETGLLVHGALALLGPGCAGEVQLVAVLELELVGVEDDVLVDVEE